MEECGMVEKRKLSLPFWCVGNPVGDPFGPGVLDKVDSLEVADILCGAAKDKLIDYTAGHDCDLVPWDPKNPEDDRDQSSETYKTLKKIKEKFEKIGLQYKMIGCNLHENRVFRNGGLANPDPRVRVLAAQKTMRALRIGSFLGAEFVTYWVARDGFETQFAVPWDRAYGYLKSALNFVTRYSRDNNLSIKRGTIEHKPNEPRGEMFLPTVGHALALISQLDHPDFWGVNPEVLQHDQMTGLNSVASAAFAASMGKLFFLHAGNQKPNQFDNDNPVLVGMDGVKEFVSILYVLGKIGWEGYVEFDNHMLRTDAAPGKANRIKLRRSYIELVVDSYRTAEKKAVALFKDRKISACQKKLWDSHGEFEAILKGGDAQKIAKTKVNYDQLVEEALGIGELDMMANKRLLGL
jgi:xylose isomerase